MYIRYTHDDFAPNEVVTSECIKRVLAEVPDFEMRYAEATRGITFHRKDLKAADPVLFGEIVDTVKGFLKDAGRIVSGEVVASKVKEVFG